jgi:ABC-type lipoprotein release transport system permease subunit
MLCAGIGAYLNSSFNANLITLRPVYFIVNVCFISGFTIFSTIVPIIRIKKIEPLKIIKARN